MAEGRLGQASLLSAPATHSTTPLYSRVPLCKTIPAGINAEKLRRFVGGAAVFNVRWPKADAFKRYGVQAKASKGQFCPLDNEVIEEVVGTEADPQGDGGGDGVFDWGNAPLESARNDFFDGVFSQLLGGKDLVDDAVTSAQQGYNTFAGGAKSTDTSKRITPEAKSPQLISKSQVQDAPAADAPAISRSPPSPFEQLPKQAAPAADAQGGLGSTSLLKRPPVQDAPPVNARGIFRSPPSLREQLPLRDAPAVDAQSSVGSSPSLLEQLPATLAPAQSVTESASGQDLWTSVQAVVINDPALTVRLAAVVAGALVVGAVWSLVQGVLGSKEEVTAQEALQALQEKGAALVDIRSKAEIALSGSPSLKSVGVRAIRFPTIVEEKDGTLVWVPDFITALKGAKGLEAGGPVLVILDKSGEEARKVAKLLKGSAFAKVLAVKGGADAWKESGLAWRKPFALDLGNVKETITRSVFPIDLENVKETLTRGPTVAAVTLGVAAAATASLVLFPGLRWVYDHFLQPNVYERQPVSQAESAIRLLGSIAALQLFSKRLLYAEDRKKTLEQIQAYLRRKAAREPNDIIEMGATMNRRDSSGQIFEEDKAEGDSERSHHHRSHKSQTASTSAKGTDQGELKSSATVLHTRPRRRPAEEPQQKGKSARRVIARKKEEEELVVAESGPVEPVMREGDHVAVVEPKQEEEKEAVAENGAEPKQEEEKKAVAENGAEPKQEEEKEAVVENGAEPKQEEKEGVAENGAEPKQQEEKEEVAENGAEEVKENVAKEKGKQRENLSKAQTQEVNDDVERRDAELEVSPLVEVVEEGKQPEEEALPKQALASETGGEAWEEGEKPEEHGAERRAAASAAVEEAQASGGELREEGGEGVFVVQEGSDEVAAGACKEDMSKKHRASQGLRKRRKAQQTTVRHQLTRHLSEHYRRRSEHR